MAFVVEFHPGRPCGQHADGSSCYAIGDAHFVVPPPDPDNPPEAPDWTGWEDAGYTTEGPPWIDMLAYRRQVAALIPDSHISRCPRCDMPWGNYGNCRFHPIWYSDRTAVSVTCEWCWAQLTTEQRILFAAGVVFGVWREAVHAPEGFVPEWPAIEAAIRAEAASETLAR